MLPSVTTILSDEGVGFDMSHLPPHYAERGTLIHLYAEKKVLGLELPQIPKKWKGYADAVDKFMFETKLEPIAIEQEFRHELLGFEGHPDFIGRMDNIATILDYKTGSIPDYCGAQLAAYEILARTELDISHYERVAVLLQPDGKYKLKTYSGMRDKAVFMEAYHGYFERRGMKWSYRS